MKNMKDSCVKWIGEIPDSWFVQRNKNCFSCSKEIVGNLSAETQLLSLTTMGIKEKKAEDSTGKIPESYDTYQIVSPNDLVMCLFDLDVSAVFSGRSQFDGMISPAYKVLKCKNTMEPSYAEYWFSFVFDGRKFKHYSKNLRYTLTYDEFAALPIVMPPKDEQLRISSFLSTRCFVINSLIEKTEKSIEEYKKLKQALITQAVTKGVRGNRPMKNSGIQWIGYIPEEWNIYRIGSLYEERKEQGDESLPILTVSINSGVSDRELSDDENDRIFVRSEDKTKYARVYPGDLTYNMMRAWQGAFGAVRVDGMVSPAYVIAKPKQVLDSRYMEALLRTEAAKQEMKRYSYGIADFRLRLYWGYFKCIKVCLPTIEEQNEIANYIDEKTKEIDELINKKQTFLEELERLKKSMIYEYVTGKKEVAS